MTNDDLAKLLVGVEPIQFDEEYKKRLELIDQWLKNTLQQCGWNDAATSVISQMVEEYLWHEDPECWEDVVQFVDWLTVFLCMGLYQTKIQSEAADEVTPEYYELFCGFAKTLAEETSPDETE